MLGVSQDGVDSHKSFSNKFGFTVDLISDTESQLMKACGIGQSEWQSVMYWDRTTFVIGPDGVIRKVYGKVKPEGHEQVLLEDIARLKGGAASH